MTDQLEILSRIDDEEVEILRRERFIKYLYESGADGAAGTIYLQAGLDAGPEDLLQAIYELIYSAYRELKDLPQDAEAGELFRREITGRLNSDAFWSDDRQEAVCTSRKEAAMNGKQFS